MSRDRYLPDWAVLLVSCAAQFMVVLDRNMHLGSAHLTQHQPLASRVLLCGGSKADHEDRLTHQ